jgi:hypothetical protein
VPGSTSWHWHKLKTKTLSNKNRCILVAITLTVIIAIKLYDPIKLDLSYTEQNMIHYGSFIAGMAVFQFLLIHSTRKSKRRYFKKLHRKKVFKKTQEHINSLKHHEV